MPRCPTTHASRPRRLAALLFLLLLALPGSSARAQEAAPPDVRLRLVEQTPWNTPEQLAFELVVSATNAGHEALTGLSLAFTLYTPVLSRNTYVQSLSEDPEGSVDLITQTSLVKGSLEPGETRTFPIAPIDLSVLAARAVTAVYPMKVELRQHDTPVAALRSPLIFLDFPAQRNRPETPLRFSWAFVLDAPVLYGPSGLFDGGKVEAFLGRHGRLREEAAALSALVASVRPVPVDLAVSPVLLDQLDRLRRGFQVRENGEVRRIHAGHGAAAAARDVLEQLRAIASSASVELSAMPLTAPNLPSLVSSSLARDFGLQVNGGRRDVARMLQVPAEPGLFRPPGSFLDQASLYALHRQDVTLLLLNPSLVKRPPQEKEFAQPPAAALSVGSGRSATAIVPDEGIQRLLASGLVKRDPRLAAQAVLGEIAQVWLEQPGITRGLAVLLPDDEVVPGALFGPLVQRVAAAPWLRRERLTRLAREFPPPQEPAELQPSIGAQFPQWYVDMIARVRRGIGTLRSMMVEKSTVPETLRLSTLVAENGGFTQDPQMGAGFLSEALRQLDRQFGSVRLAGNQTSVVTLTSRGGVVPISIENAGAQPFRVEIRLQSSHLEFLPGQEARTVELDPRSTLPLTFRVQARTTGTFPVQVVLATPSGVRLGDPYTLTVRSKAYNFIALIVTIGAAAFLLLWWARRFLPRTRS